jgi:hypothetical protein
MQLQHTYTYFCLASLKIGKLYSKSARLSVLLLKVLLQVVKSYFIASQKRENRTLLLLVTLLVKKKVRLNEHFQNKVYLFLSLRDKSLCLCIEVAYSRYRSRSLVLMFYLSFRKAGNRRRYFPTRYL